MGVITFYFSMLSLLAPLIVVVAVGLAWGKKRTDFPAQFITVLATSVSTPALVLHTLVTTQLSNEIIATVAGAGVFALVLAAAVCAGVLKLLKQPVRKLLPTCTFPNAGNLGLPISHMAFGDAGLSTAIAFFAICSFVQHTIGVRLLPNAHGMTSPWKSPIFIAAVAAVLCRATGYTPPGPVLESAELLGSLTVPLMLLGLGHALAIIPLSSLRTGSIVAAMRLSIGLGAGYAAGWLFGMPANLQSAMALQMAMPCAVVSYMYARRYTDTADVSAGAVLISTVAFLILSPVLLWLVGSTAAG